jgi:hypothetical protein
MVIGIGNEQAVPLYRHIEGIINLAEVPVPSKKPCVPSPATVVTTCALAESGCKNHPRPANITNTDIDQIEHRNLITCLLRNLGRDAISAVLF